MTAHQRHKTWGDKIEEQLAEREEKKKAGKILMRAKDMVWGDNKMSTNAMMVSEMTGFPIKTMHAFIGEIEPGGKAGKHRHASEAIMLALAGKAYSVIDGERYDWEAGDCLAVPSMSEHQHFNASDSEPFRYYAVSNWELTVAIGLGWLDTPENSSRYKD